MVEVYTETAVTEQKLSEKYFSIALMNETEAMRLERRIAAWVDAPVNSIAAIHSKQLEETVTAYREWADWYLKEAVRQS